MHLKSVGMISVGLIVVIMVCVKQTFAASSDIITPAENIVPTSANLVLDDYWTYEGENNGDEMGWSVSGAGDVNGDGKDDIIVGSPKFGDDPEGYAFVFHGREGGLISTPDWTEGSGMQGARFGNSVSSAGDVNNDGYDDVIIGAPDYKVDFDLSEMPKSGAVFVYHGSVNGLPDDPYWYVLAEAKEISLGYSVSGAGDVNGDGFDDVIVGAPYYESEPAHTNEGKVYLYLGSSNGLEADPSWTFECDLYLASCGAALGSAGDVNGDSLDDIVIGAPNYNAGFTRGGAAFVFYGSTSSISASPDWTIFGDQEEAQLGSSVASSGNVNGDKFDDLLVGAPHYSLEDNSNIGAVFEFHGSNDGPSLVYDWITYGPETGSMYGASVNRAGDIDQDGYGDVIIGAYLFGISDPDSPNQPDEGAAYIFQGSPSGLELQHSWLASGNKAEAHFGFSVGSAGNINGDSFEDVIIGAPKYREDQRLQLGEALAYYSQKPVRDYYVFLPLISVQAGD